MLTRYRLVFAFPLAAMLVSGLSFGQESVVASAASAMHGASKDDQIIRQLIKMNEEMVAAQVRGDVPAIEKFLADDYTKLHESNFIPAPPGVHVEGGGNQNRAEFLKDNYPGRYLAIDLSDVTGRVFGTTAVLNGHTRTKRAKNETWTTFMNVWVERNGVWKVTLWATVAQRPVDSSAH